MTDWTKFKVLKKDSPRFKWGEVEKMDPLFLETLDFFLHNEGLECQVNFGTQGEHLGDSQHFLGRAVDIMFPGKLLRDIPDIFYAAIRYDFHGVGIYSEWKLSREGKCMGGLHLDRRDAGYVNYVRKALWLWGPKGEEALKWMRVKELFL